MLLLRFIEELVPELTVPSPDDLRDVPDGFADCDLLVTVLEDLREVVTVDPFDCLEGVDCEAADLLPLLVPEVETASLLGLSGFTFAYSASPSLLESGRE